MRVLFPTRAGLGGDPYIPPQATAIDDFSAGGAGNRYRAHVPDTVGEALGFTVWSVVRVDSNTFASQKIFNDGSGIVGWGIDSEPAGYRFRMGSTAGGGTSYFSADAPFSAVGLVDRIVGVFDWAAMRVRIYLNGVEVGPATVFTGLPELDTGAVYQTAIGSGSTGGEAAVDYAVLAAGYTPVISSAADILAWDAAVQASLGLATLPSATVQWRAVDAGDPPGTPWLDAISAASLTRDNAPTSVSFTPSWAP